jgi:hypothetical protein
MLDRLEEGELVETAEGRSLVRTGYVTALDGETDETTIAQEALDAEGVPKIYDEHPSISNFWVTKVSAIPISHNKAKIRIDYEWSSVSSTPKVSGETTLQEVETNLDYAGNLLAVTLTIPYPSGVAFTQGVKLKKFDPVLVLNFNRKEAGSPEDIAKEFIGKVNSAEWRGYPVGCILCNRIEWREDAMGDFDVSYQFLYRPEFTLNSNDYPGWDVVVAYTDPDTGQVDGRVTEGNGMTVKSPYAMADFADLHLAGES